MLKALKEKKALLFLIVVIIIALITFAGCQTQNPEEQGTTPQNNTAPTVAAPQPQEQAPEDLKGFTDYTIRKQLGEKNNIGKDRIRKTEIEGSSADNLVTIELNGNDAFLADITVRGMLMDSKKVLGPLSKRQDVSSVSISEYLEVDDIGGGTVDEWVFTITLDRKGLDKVAGGDYLLDDLTKLAKVYKLHPNFNKSTKQTP